jgi:hypothetical protein
MKLISEYRDQPVKLVCRSLFGFDYDLIAGQEIIASFKCTRTFSFTGQVKGFGRNNIEFYKEKFWTWNTSIREEGKENPFALHKREIGFCTGIIELPKGNRFRVIYGFFYMTTIIENEKGNTIAVLKRSNFLSRNINVIIKEKSTSLDENPWVIFMALYIILKGMMRRA